jgi:hypothetical protein
MPVKNGGVPRFPNQVGDVGAFFFNNFRSGTYKKFPILYGDQDEERPREERKSTPEEVVQSVVDYYYQSLMLCAQDDVLKVSPILNLNLMEVLSYLSYRIDKANKERQKQQNTIT